MTSPPAGWFPDPLHRHELRYWSGAAWTEHVSDGGRGGIDQLTTPSPLSTTTASAWATPAQAPGPAAGPPGVAQVTVTAPAAPGPRTGLILAGVFGMLAVALVAVLVLLIRGDGEDAAGTVVVSGPASSGIETTIGEPGGVQIAVPAGAIPLTASEEVANIVIAAERVAELPEVDLSALPEGVTISTETYRLSPIGQTFQVPVRVSVPIPGEIPVDEVGGIAVLDESDGTWVPLDSVVDEAAGMISAEMTHFTIMAPWRSTSGRITGEGEPPTQPRPGGGYIQVVNPIPEGRFPTPSPALPGYDRPPQFPRMSRSYGLCVLDYTLDDPRVSGLYSWHLGAPLGTFTDQYGVVERFGARLGVSSSPSTPNAPRARWWFMPAGTYTFGEFWSGSEINPSDPLYLPLRAEAQQQMTLRVDEGGVYTFDVRDTPFSRVSPLDGGWVLNRPGCFGPVVPTPQSGAIQISLNWPQTGIDLDLHVIDPNGDEIYYRNRSVPSGGFLDWDNTNGGNQPENVYWESGPPSGTYRVAVNYFGGSGPATWTVRVVIDGSVQTYQGRIASGRTEVTTFQIP